MQMINEAGAIWASGRRGAPRPAGLARRLAGRLAALVFALCIVTILTAILLTRVPVLGYRTVILSGGSMEPALDNGSLLLTKHTEASSLAPGDIITFNHPGGDITITHRIVSMRLEGDQRWFTLKGDANRTADPDEVGVAQSRAFRTLFAIPYAGYALAFLSSTPAALLLIVLPALGLAAQRLPGVQRGINA